MKKNKTSFTMSLILLAVSVIFTLLVAFVGKAPVGPENSEVGFAALNAALSSSRLSRSSTSRSAPVSTPSTTS